MTGRLHRRTGRLHRRTGHAWADGSGCLPMPLIKTWRLASERPSLIISVGHPAVLNSRLPDEPPTVSLLSVGLASFTCLARMESLMGATGPILCWRSRM